MAAKKKSSKTLGERIDEVFEKDQEIDELEADLRELKKQREVLETELLTAMVQDEVEQSRGKRANATIRKTVYPSIADRQKFQKWVYKNKAIELLQNRISVTAYNERKEAGIIVPGTKEFEKTWVSITKRK